jgi:hypothetical protein
VGEGGREYDDDALAEYGGAKTELDYANWLRSKEIADFFSRTGFALPDAGSEAYDEALDYTDVQLKIIQQEGYDAHDFNIFDDRAAELWRKPYVDGAVRELTRSFHPAGQQKPRTRAGEGLAIFSVSAPCWLPGSPSDTLAASRRGDRTALEACSGVGGTCFPHLVLTL